MRSLALPGAALGVALLVLSPATGAAVAAPLDSLATQQSAPQQTPPPGTPPQQNPPGARQQNPPGTQPPTGQENSARDRALAHLNAARDRLVEVTKMPETQKLQGAARTQLNTLITQFNALISSTGPEWKDNFQKVRETMATLLPKNAGETGAAQSGAVGTSGAVSLDPAVEAKLKEFDSELDLFAQEAGVPETGQTTTSGAATGSATSGTAGEGAPSEVERHLDALDDLVDQVLAANPQTGSDAPVTIDRAKLQEMLRHVQQLRQAIKDKR